MPSLADWIGSLLYLLTGIAAVTASRRAQTRSSRRHWRFITAFIMALIPWRLLQIEEAARETLRAALVADDLYRERADLQIPVAAGFLALGAIVAGLYVARAKGRPWQSSASGLAVGAMLSLIVIRLVSLHMFDRLLYASVGPLRLHYFAEFALLVVISGAALYREGAAKGKILPLNQLDRRTISPRKLQIRGFRLACCIAKRFAEALFPKGFFD